jgi:molybdenum cofactor biosynthesis enzyme MoaA
MHGDMNYQDVISKEKMFEILHDFSMMGVKAITYSGGGEPLLHKDIVSILNKTLELGIDLSILTNGQMLSDDRAEALYNAKWIRISMDYWNEDMFKESRGLNQKSFIQICDNISNFAKNKNPKCDLGVNYIVTKENHKSLVDAYNFLYCLGVDNIRFSPVWLPDFYKYHSKIKKAVLEQIEFINKERGQVFHSYNIEKEVNHRSYSKCYFMQVVPVIGADLNVYNCHNKAYDSNGCIGSIKNKRFIDLWYSPQTMEYMNDFRPDVLCNHQCANDKKNIYIHEIINSYGDNYV